MAKTVDLAVVFIASDSSEGFDRTTLAFKDELIKLIDAVH